MTSHSSSGARRTRRRPRLGWRPFRPLVEKLEDRLPPGDLLGVLFPAGMDQLPVSAANSTPQEPDSRTVELATRQVTNLPSAASSRRAAEQETRSSSAPELLVADDLFDGPLADQRAITVHRPSPMTALFGSQNQTGMDGAALPGAVRQAVSLFIPGSTAAATPAPREMEGALTLALLQSYQSSSATASPEQTARFVSSDFAQGGFYVQLAPGQEGAINQLLPRVQANGATVEATVLDGAYQVNGDAGALAALANAFAAQPFVRHVVPLTGEGAHVAAIPDDPRFLDGTQWALNGTYGIQAPAAWDRTTGSTALVIAHLDTGIDYTHPDIFQNIWVNQGEIPPSRLANLIDTDGDTLITLWDLNEPINQGPDRITDVNGNGRIDGGDLIAPMAGSFGGWSDSFDQDSNTRTDDLIGWNFFSNTNNPMDDFPVSFSHGTLTGGMIGAIGNNGVGISGGLWKTQVMVLKFIGATGIGPYPATAAAIRYAADHARLSNNSWTIPEDNPLVRDAMTYATARDHLFVAVAGNEGRNLDVFPSWPAVWTNPNMVVVGGTDIAGELAPYSNYSATSVDLAGPGGRSAFENPIYSTVRGGTYNTLAGTSAAGPYVTVTAAMLLIQNPSLTSAGVINRLLTTVTSRPSLTGFMVSPGIVNADQATTPTEPSEAIADDGTESYWQTETGWEIYPEPAGYGPTVRYAAPGFGEALAAWVFTGLAPGVYSVLATWPAWGAGMAPDTPFYFWDNATPAGQVRVDQVAGSSGPVFGGVPFQTLSTSVTVLSGTLWVGVSNDANGYVAADAVRVVRTA